MPRVNAFHCWNDRPGRIGIEAPARTSKSSSRSGRSATTNEPPSFDTSLLEHRRVWSSRSSRQSSDTLTPATGQPLSSTRRPLTKRVLTRRSVRSAMSDPESPSTFILPRSAPALPFTSRSGQPTASPGSRNRPPASARVWCARSIRPSAPPRLPRTGRPCPTHRQRAPRPLLVAGRRSPVPYRHAIWRTPRPSTRHPCRFGTRSTGPPPGT